MIEHIEEQPRDILVYASKLEKYAVGKEESEPLLHEVIIEAAKEMRRLHRAFVAYFTCAYSQEEGVELSSQEGEQHVRNLVEQEK